MSLIIVKYDVLSYKYRYCKYDVLSYKENVVIINM